MHIPLLRRTNQCLGSLYCDKAKAPRPPTPTFQGLDSCLTPANSLPKDLNNPVGWSSLPEASFHPSKSLICSVFTNATRPNLGDTVTWSQSVHGLEITVTSNTVCGVSDGTLPSSLFQLALTLPCGVCRFITCQTAGGRLVSAAHGLWCCSELLSYVITKVG